MCPLEDVWGDQQLPVFIFGPLHNATPSNAVAFKGYTSVLSKMVSVIFAVLEVSFWALRIVVKLPWKFLTLIRLNYRAVTDEDLAATDRPNPVQSEDVDDYNDVSGDTTADNGLYGLQCQ